MIFVPLIIVCLILILSGLLIGFIRGESMGKMAKELFSIYRSAIGPLFTIILVILLICLILWLGYLVIDVCIDRLVTHY